MGTELREKIEKYHGWDFCEHQKIRNYCEECMWEVPAYMRKAEKPLTSCDENVKIQLQLI